MRFVIDRIGVQLINLNGRILLRPNKHDYLQSGMNMHTLTLIRA